MIPIISLGAIVQKLNVLQTQKSKIYHSDDGFKVKEIPNTTLTEHAIKAVQVYNDIVTQLDYNNLILKNRPNNNWSISLRFCLNPYFESKEKMYAFIKHCWFSKEPNAKNKLFYFSKEFDCSSNIASIVIVKENGLQMENDSSDSDKWKSQHNSNHVHVLIIFRELFNTNTQYFSKNIKSWILSYFSFISKRQKTEMQKFDIFKKTNTVEVGGYVVGDPKVDCSSEIFPHLLYLLNTKKEGRDLDPLIWVNPIKYQAINHPRPSLEDSLSTTSESRKKVKVEKRIPAVKSGLITHLVLKNMVEEKKMSMDEIKRDSSIQDLFFSSHQAIESHVLMLQSLLPKMERSEKLLKFLTNKLSLTKILEMGTKKTKIGFQIKSLIEWLNDKNTIVFKNWLTTIFLQKHESLSNNTKLRALVIVGQSHIGKSYFSQQIMSGPPFSCFRYNQHSDKQKTSNIKGNNLVHDTDMFLMEEFTIVPKSMTIPQFNQMVSGGSGNNGFEMRGFYQSIKFEYPMPFVITSNLLPQEWVIEWKEDPSLMIKDPFFNTLMSRVTVWDWNLYKKYEVQLDKITMSTAFPFNIAQFKTIKDKSVGNQIFWMLLSHCWNIDYSNIQSEITLDPEVLNLFLSQTAEELIIPEKNESIIDVINYEDSQNNMEILDEFLDEYI